MVISLPPVLQCNIKHLVNPKYCLFHDGSKSFDVHHNVIERAQVTNHLRLKLSIILSRIVLSSPGSLGVTIHLESSTITLSSADVLNLGRQVSNLLTTTNLTLPGGQTTSVLSTSLVMTDDNGNVVIGM